jgi:serine/threonine-protein kinase
VTAYEMLTGCPPFSGLAPQALLAAHATMAVPPVRERRAATPVALADVVMACLEKRPADRPQSADEVLRVLESITTPSGTMPRAESASITSIRGRHGLWGLGMIAAAAIGVAAVLATRSHLASNASAGPEARTESVAVLPFVNVEHDTAAEYLGDGIADELTTTLATVPGLRVAARSSAFRV